MKVTLNVSSYDASNPDVLLTLVAEQIIKVASRNIARQHNIVEYEQHKLADMQRMREQAEQRANFGW